MSMKSIRVVKELPNGYLYIRDYSSGLTGLYTKDGKYYSGDLRLSFFDAIKIISK